MTFFRPKPALTAEEAEAIAAFDGEVKQCPPGYHIPTWRISTSLNSVIKATGGKVGGGNGHY